ETVAQFPDELTHAAFESKNSQHLPPDIDEFWKLESIGISDNPIENDDEKALESFRQSVRFQDGRYHVSWPWIEENRKRLPTNYDLAYRRFETLTTRLKSDPSLLKAYQNTIDEQTKRGFVETVPQNELNPNHTVHYLPHHPVFKPSSATTKVRIVYDASAKQSKNSVSLNECLVRGPVIMPDLCLMLIRFRCGRTVVTSDIEKAYLHVALHLEDRDVTRFFWYRDDKNPLTDPANIVIKRFARVPFGIICSAFLLAVSILHHLENEGSDFAKSLAQDIYVDNVISSVPENQSVMEYYENSRKIFAQAGMNLREFCSNSQEFMDSIPAENRVKERDTHVLGMQWDSGGDDSLRVVRSPKWGKDKRKLTKRGILQTVASIFDPLGLSQPVMLPATLLLRDIWKIGKSWDATLGANIADQWFSIQQSLDGIHGFRIPRFLGEINSNCSIAAFGDASKQAYGVAVYIRVASSNSKFSSHLIFSKSRLAPACKSGSQKNNVTVTLPRLELLGATIAARASNFCRESFPKTKLHIHLFSDSECVLHWLNSKKDLRRFVDSRVTAIRSINDCSFHYVGTNDNPADMLTRGKAIAELNDERLWWNGPAWLSLPESEWPQTNLPKMSSDALREVKDNKSVELTFANVADASWKGPFGIEFGHFSNLQKLIRVVWCILKFLRLKIFEKLSNESKEKWQANGLILSKIDKGAINENGYEATLQFLVRFVQKSEFGKDISSLKNGTKTPLINQLNLQIDSENLIRICSRYRHADLPETARCPVLLPKNHSFSELVVEDIHSKNKHVGPAQTLSELRRLYWIPNGRAYVQKVLRQCIPCRIYKTSPTFKLPEMPPWPKERVSRSAPFQFVGIDYFGPMSVKIGSGTSKMWACLFTCLATRGVHLEPVSDCTTVEFFNALLRFMARRGYPSQIISDNAAQFHLTHILADKAWKKVP
ncbi:MAG: hypothetical protein AAF587_44285, partial [Bacteroidota bacterium]